MHIIVSYDVIDDRRRNRLSKGLEGFLVRVQKSVFEGEIPRQRLEDLYRLIETECDYEQDSIRVYRLCLGCTHQVDVLGVGTWISADGDEVI